MKINDDFCIEKFDFDYSILRKEMLQNQKECGQAL